VVRRIALPSIPLAHALLAGLVVIVVLLSGWLLYSWFASHERAMVWDFITPWLGMRTMLQDGHNPYGEAVTREIQLAKFGRPAYPHEDKQAFAYPLSAMVIIGPLALLPLPAAQATWFLILAGSWLVFLFVAQRAVQWRPSLWLWALTLLCAFAIYQNVWAFILGQISIVVAAWVALAWWGLRSGHWTVAGVCLAVATIKPQMTFVIVPAMLVWALWQRHTRVAVAFGVALTILVGLPLFWQPDWPSQWIDQVYRYADYTIFQSPAVLLTGASWAGWVVAGLMLLWPVILWQCGRWRPEAPQWQNWLFSWLIALTAMVSPRTSTVNQVILLLPLFYIFGRLGDSTLIAILEGALVGTTWLIVVLFLTPITDRVQYSLAEHQLISPILPVAVTVALWALTLWPQRKLSV
jgi:hypothetical protein